MVATVTAGENVTAVQAGVANIRATADGRTDSNIRRSHRVVESCATGASAQFTATTTLSNSATENVSDSAVWSSSNTVVATVTGGGNVTAVQAGVANIRATVDGVSDQVESHSYRAGADESATTDESATASPDVQSLRRHAGGWLDSRCQC